MKPQLWAKDLQKLGLRMNFLKMMRMISKLTDSRTTYSFALKRATSKAEYNPLRVLATNHPKRSILSKLRLTS